MYDSSIKTFEELRDYIAEAKHDTMEVLVDRIDELNAFQRGMYKGEIMGYDEVLGMLRSILKYGESGHELECREEMD